MSSPCEVRTYTLDSYTYVDEIHECLAYIYMSSVCTLAYQGLFTVEVPTGPRLFAGRCATLEETYGPGETRWKPRAVTFPFIYIAIVYNPFLLRKWRNFDSFENLAKTDTLRQFTLACIAQRRAER